MNTTIAAVLLISAGGLLFAHRLHNPKIESAEKTSWVSIDENEASTLRGHLVYTGGGGNSFETTAAYAEKLGSNPVLTITRDLSGKETYAKRL